MLHLKVIENRTCTGVDGKDTCCLGFSLNRTTGNCEKCSIGFYGKGCLQKCIYPFFGEDCQHVCHCPKDDCHFSHGCLPRAETVSYQKISSSLIYSTKISISTSTVSTAGITKETEWQAMYQSLNREAVDTQSTTYPEQRRFNVNSVYLSPVFNRSESSETPHGSRENDMRLQINEVLQEISIDSQGYDSSITEIEPNFLNDGVNHIYVEIAEDNT
uniref:Uncharacterized protein n=1 Tax=Magallana gigas TaxID=29159 RepID=A0A8W8JBX5_MAGGI